MQVREDCFASLAVTSCEFKRVREYSYRASLAVTSCEFKRVREDSYRLRSQWQVASWAVTWGWLTSFARRNDWWTFAVTDPLEKLYSNLSILKILFSGHCKSYLLKFQSIFLLAKFYSKLFILNNGIIHYLTSLWSNKYFTDRIRELCLRHGCQKSMLSLL